MSLTRKRRERGTGLQISSDSTLNRGSICLCLTVKSTLALNLLLRIKALLHSLQLGVICLKICGIH